jgi:hypothetical protein
MSSEEADYPGALGDTLTIQSPSEQITSPILSSGTDLFTEPALSSGTELFSDGALSSGTDLFSDGALFDGSALTSGTEISQSGGSKTLSRRVSNAIHKFLKESAKGGAKSKAYTRSRKRMQQRRKRRSQKVKGLRAYPIVGPALDTVVRNVAKPLQMVDNLVVKAVQGHGRNAIKLVASPLTRGIKALGKKRSSKKSLKKPSKRSGKKRSSKK